MNFEDITIKQTTGAKILEIEKIRKDLIIINKIGRDIDGKSK